jgi:hypothetical protein
MLFEATFKPSKEMKYNEDALKLANTKIALYQGWIVKEGPFKGQQCYYVPNSNVGWIPVSDLTELRPISTVQWQDLHKSCGFAV